MVSQIWSAMDRTFCHFGLFLPFYPPNNPKFQNFEKMKQPPADIILHKCTTNGNYMIYCLEILSFYTSAPQMTMI